MYFDRETFVIQQMMGQSPWWLLGGLVLAILLILVFRAPAVQRTGLFRCGVLSLAGAIIATPITTPALMAFGGAGANGLEYHAILLRALAPMFTACGFVFIAFSLLPKPKFDSNRQTSIPAKHPLDD
jgi:hypothetical protein